MSNKVKIDKKFEEKETEPPHVSWSKHQGGSRQCMQWLACLY